MPVYLTQRLCLCMESKIGCDCYESDRIDHGEAVLLSRLLYGDGHTYHVLQELTTINSSLVDGILASSNGLNQKQLRLLSFCTVWSFLSL